MKESYSTGSVSGDNWIGGLVGRNDGTVSNSYSTGSVSGDHYVGGLVGYNDDDGIVNTTYSTGRVYSPTGNDYVGGLVGENKGDVSRSFWNTETSYQLNSDGGTPKNDEQMKSIATFLTEKEKWTIEKVNKGDDNKTLYTWNIVEGETYPFLSWQPV